MANLFETRIKFFESLFFLVLVHGSLGVEKSGFTLLKHVSKSWKNCNVLYSNASVIMSSKSYHEKMEKLLSSPTCNKIYKDPTVYFERKTIKLLKNTNWKPSISK